MRRWNLSDLALARPVSVGMALVAVILLGLIGLAQMPLAFLPSQQAARAYVFVSISRTSPEVLEREVVRPIEETVAGLRGLTRIQVSSGSWGVRVNLDFAPGTDADARKLDLRDRIDRVRGTLPEFVQNVEVGSSGNEDDPIMEIHISSGTDLSEDYYLIEEHVVRVLERVRGVARVELDGVSPHELEIGVDLDDVASSGVSLSELGAAVRSARQGRSYGVLRGETAEVGVRTPSEDASAERFAELPVRRGEARRDLSLTPDQADEPGVRFARLGEVARVREQPQESRRGKRLNGRRAIDLEIYASARASVVEVSERVQAAIDEMGEDPALDGIDVLVVQDQGRMIRKTLADLRDSGIYGGILAILVLFLFLHRWGTTLAAALCIPVSVLTAGAVLFVRGEELNCIVLLGLVLGVGMLIDNAVVIVEAIASHARAGKPPLEATRAGARQVGFATIASTLSTVIVFIPLMFSNATDKMAAYMGPLGTTLAIALIASLVVSQTGVALLMGRLLPVRAGRVTHHPVLDAIARAYAWVIARTLQRPRLALLFGLALAGTAIWPAMRLEMKLGRETGQPDHLPIRLEFIGSRNVEKIEAQVIVLEDALLANRHDLGIASVSCSYSDHWANCRVYPSVAFESEGELEEFVKRVGAALPEQLGVRYRLNESQMHWRDSTDGHVAEFALKGEEVATLMELSRDVAAHLAEQLERGDPNDPETTGYDVISTPYTDGAQELQIKLDGSRLRALGLDADTVAQRVSLAFQGVPLGKVRGERGELDLRLTTRGDAEQGPGIEDVRNLPLVLAGGGEVPLGSVAELTLERQPWWIQRVDRQTEIRLQVRFFRSDLRGNFAAVTKAMEGFVFPPGYSWGKGTAWRTEREANLEMLVNLGLCLLLVYAVMASLFESYWQPMGILLTCLLGAFGAPWALWLTHTSVDYTAVVGLFILVGVVVNNGIMLIDRTTALRATGLARDAALQEAGRDRLRPILMTVTTTVLGLVPMLIHHPTLAGIYYHAIAIVLVGGLLTSTVITLIFLPAAYVAIEETSLALASTWDRFYRGRSRRL